jgi:hypothetical protein
MSALSSTLISPMSFTAEGRLEAESHRLPVVEADQRDVVGYPAAG